jgi:Protein of unknown function (DUF3617)
MLVGMICLLLARSVDGQTPRRDGNWQMTVELTSGVPTRVGGEIGTTMAPFTTTQCISPKMANDRAKFTSQGAGIGVKAPVSTGSDCKVDYKVTGAKETWAVKCTGANPLTGTGEFTLTNDTYSGSMNLIVPGRVRNADGTDSWRDVPITMKYSGKRLGDCTK